MFEKKTYIYSEALGVCHVDDITSLSQKKSEPVAYYVLRSYFQQDKVSYIPVNNHAVLLRNLITKEEAIAKRDEFVSKGLLQAETQKQEEDDDTQVGTIDWEIQYKMADTLPDTQRKLLYDKGEIEFVLHHQDTLQVMKNKNSKNR